MNRSTSPSRALQARLSDESGIAMIIAMVAMLVIGVLAAGAVTLSVSTNTQARENVQQKEALEASEAGLQVALYRYNMQAPTSTNCVNDTTVTTPTNGVCASSPTPTGSGATYQYWDTPAIGTSTPCTGPTVSSSAGVSNICITAVGKAGNQTARTEIRAAAYAAQPLFPYGAGIIGLNGVTINKNGAINGGVASNQTISLSNNTVVNGVVEYGPAQGKVTLGNNASVSSTSKLANNITLSPVDPGNTATNNSNASLLSGNALQGATYTNTVLDPRDLNLGNGGSATLSGGIYNFCSITGNQGTISTTTGSKVEIFIDSIADPGSGCLNTGVLDVKNGISFADVGSDATGLQIYVYGPNADVYIKNNNNTDSAVLYAPTSTVTFKNNGFFTGAIAGLTVNFDNNQSFTYGGSTVGSLDAITQGLYYRTAWGTCTATISTSNPTSGCS